MLKILSKILVLSAGCLSLFVSPALALRVVDQQVILDELDDYNMCQGRDYTGEFCHDALKRWVKAHPDDAFKAGKMTRLKMNHSNAIVFFAQAFEKGKGDCKDDDVKLAVVSALGLPASNTDVISKAKKIGLDSCFSELKQSMADAAAENSYAFTNVCKELLAKGVIKGLTAKRCQALK